MAYQLAGRFLFGKTDAIFFAQIFFAAAEIDQFAFGHLVNGFEGACHHRA